MVETKLTYLALLENADSSIINLPLEHDYKFILMEFNEALEFLCRLHGNTMRPVDIAMLKGIDADNEGNVIFITKDYPISTGYPDVQKEEITYLIPKINLLRFFNLSHQLCNLSI